MELQIVLPETLGEWLAWLTALGTVVAGLAIMLMPRKLMDLLGLEQIGENKSGLSEFRGAFGGVYVGLGLAILLLHPQPLMYFALGCAFVGAVVGRIISRVVDGAWGKVIAVGAFAELLGAIFPLAYVFGWIA